MALTIRFPGLDKCPHDNACGSLGCQREATLAELESHRIGVDKIKPLADYEERKAGIEAQFPNCPKLTKEG